MINTFIKTVYILDYVCPGDFPKLAARNSISSIKNPAGATIFKKIKLLFLPYGLMALTLNSCNLGNTALSSIAEINQTELTLESNIRPVSDWGATPNTTPEKNSLALNQAFSWLSVHPNNKLSFVPNSVYRVSQRLVLNIKGNAEILGNNSILDSQLSNLSVLFQIQGIERKIAVLSNDARKFEQQIDFTYNLNPNLHAENDLTSGDSIIITQDIFEYLDSDLQIKVDSIIAPYPALSKVQIYPLAGDVANSLLTKQRIGQSIVLLNTQLQAIGPTILITDYQPASGYLIGVIGNNNPIESSVIPSAKWALTNLWDPARGYYIKGEIASIASINKNHIWLNSPLMDSYPARNTNLYKISAAKLSIKDLNLKSSTSNGDINLNIQGISNVTLDNVHILQARQRGMVLSHIANLNINNSSISGIPATSDQTSYGLAINSSQNVLINGGTYATGNHAITFGGSFPNRNISLNKVIINTPVTDYALDFHGNSESVSLNSINSSGGFGYSGINLQIESSTFTDSSSFSTAIFISPERKNGDILIHNSYIFSLTGNSLSISNAFVDMFTQPEKNVSKFINKIEIKNCQIISKAQQKTNMHAIYMQPLSQSTGGLTIQSLNIDHSKLYSESGYALAIENNANILAIESTEIRNSILDSPHNTVIYIVPQTNNQNMNTNLLINDSTLISGQATKSIILDYLNSIRLSANQLNGSNQARSLALLYFNNASILGNVFVNWLNNVGLPLSQNDLDYMLSAQSNINPYNESAGLSIRNNIAASEPPK